MACLHGLLWKCFAICCPLVPSFICGYTWLTNCLCFGPRCLLWSFPFPLGHFQSPGQCASPPVVENIDRKAYCLNIWGQIIQAPLVQPYLGDYEAEVHTHLFLQAWKWSSQVWGVWGGWKQGAERRKEHRRALISIKAKLKGLESKGGWLWLKIKAWRWLWLSDLLAESSRGFFLMILMALRAACTSPKLQEERNKDVRFPITWFSFGGDRVGGIWVSCSREESRCFSTSMASGRPRANTTTIAYLFEAGCRIGKGLFLHQAVCSVEAWAGNKEELSWNLEHEIEQVAF